MKAEQSLKPAGRRERRTAIPRDKCPGRMDQDNAKSPSVFDERDEQNTMGESASFLLAQMYLKHLLNEKRDQPGVRQFGTKFIEFFRTLQTAEEPSQVIRAMARYLVVLCREALQSLPEQEHGELVAKAWAIRPEPRCQFHDLLSRVGTPHDVKTCLLLEKIAEALVNQRVIVGHDDPDIPYERNRPGGTSTSRRRGVRDSFNHSLAFRFHAWSLPMMTSNNCEQS